MQRDDCRLNIDRTGPFKTGQDAVKAMTLVNGHLPDNLCIWPEGKDPMEVFLENLKECRRVRLREKLDINWLDSLIWSVEKTIKDES